MRYSLLINDKEVTGKKTEIVLGEIKFECHDFQFVDKKHFIVNGAPFTLSGSLQIFGIHKDGMNGKT